MNKRILTSVVVVIVVIVCWRFYKHLTASGPRSRAGQAAGAVAVETKPISIGDIHDIGVFTGSFEPKSQFVVAPKVGGWLKKLLLDVGDTVEPNQVIALLDDEEFAQQVEQSRAELEVAKANAANSASDLDIARREYERAKALREKQIASASELDVSEAAFNASQTRYKVSLAQQAQREAALKTAEVRLSYTKVQTFWEEGDIVRVVGERFVDEGALVQVNQPIVSILQNDPLKAVVYVIEKDYPKVRTGQQASITTDAYPGRTFTGMIVRIAPLLKESSRQARLELEVPNSEHLLKPGMFVRAQVEFARHEKATLVPFAAVVKRAGREGLFVADEQKLKVHFVPIKTGIQNGEVVEIAEPQITGLVVTMGSHLLEDGADILLPKTDSKAQSNSKISRDANAPVVNTPAGGRR